MQRGNLSNSPTIRILVDYRCLVSLRPVDNLWEGAKHWWRTSPRRRKLWAAEAVSTWVESASAGLFLSTVLSKDATAHIAYPAHEAPQSNLLRLLNDMWAEQLVEVSAMGEARRLLDTAGYACFVTPDHHLLTGDTSVQLYTGPHHRFT